MVCLAIVTSLLVPAIDLASAAVRPAPVSSARRIGLAPRLPRGTKALGALVSSKQLSLDVVLRPRDPAGIAQLAQEVSTPGTPEYRQVLSPGAFARRFGAPPSELASVEASLRRQGLHVAGVSGGGLTVRVVTTAGAAQRALATPMLSYRLSSGRIGYANVEAPRVPADMAHDVMGVLGLNSLDPSVPAGLVREPSLAKATAHATHAAGRSAGITPSASCSAAIAGSGAGYSADQIAKAYGYDHLYAGGDLGVHTTIAVIEFSSFRSSDLAAYAACYSGVVPRVRAVPVDGGPGNFDQTSEVEAELDVEVLLGLVPHARIVVYEGPNDGGSPSNAANYDALAAAIDQDKAQVLTTSWGECEQVAGDAAAQAENLLFEQAALQGQSMVAAAGDNGSEDCSTGAGGSRASLAVDDPASQPFVTAVGGTTLRIGASPTETTWNTGPNSSQPGAGGGGLSSIWRMPTYQAKTPPSLGVLGPYAKTGRCRAAGDRCRESPDVSANAGAPYAIYCTESGFDCSGTGWTPIGGTSAAAPTFAALLALADSSGRCLTQRPIGFANPALYAIAAGPSSSSAFFDVTSGNNDLLGTEGGLYPATPGYDLSTGLGTPIAGDGSDNGLAAQLCSLGSMRADAASTPAPSVSAVVPATARTGATVVIVGRNLSGALGVHFGLRRAPFHVVSSRRVVAVVPAGSGLVHVTVVGRARISRRSRADVFTYGKTPPTRAKTG
ncbi:MAG: Pro-kumamolisin, activation domain [Acidimicrobiaceae bacterium]|nr:Pro-kumamolisin, activation domain [Acidimicrobiaceae bacterium]